MKLLIADVTHQQKTKPEQGALVYRVLEGRGKYSKSGINQEILEQDLRLE